jgi:hypothetical protein
MNCKRCGKYIGEYSGHGRPRCYCELCIPKNNEERLKNHLLGTTDIEAKMSRKKDGEPDFKKEQNAIRKELRELGLRK